MAPFNKGILQMLYKYIGNHDKEETIKCLKYFLEDGTIKASDPFSFNDPSELKNRPRTGHYQGDSKKMVSQR
ncbi:hypothetical protein RKJ46_28515 [Klebsiella pneumoniae]|nr:hypothetical protein [Klebsiella pneumoniae]